MPSYGELKQRAQNAALQYGDRYVPTLTKQLTKPPNPSFAVWGQAFGYLILTVYIFLDLLQFVDIFSNDVPLLMGISSLRLIIYLVSVAISIYSVYMGWRTVPISIVFQMTTVAISVLTGLIKTIYRSYVFFKDQGRQNMTWFSYAALIIPIVQTVISSIGLYFLYQEYQTDVDSRGKVNMIGLFIGAVVGLITAVIGLIKHSGVMGTFNS